MWLEMKVRGLALDPLSNMPIIILRDEDDKRSLPIWVGIFEANAIALELEKISTPRPMTHDLIKNILEAIEARVVKVAVTDLKENTFFAVLHLQVAGAERKSTRLNSSHGYISYAVFCLKKKIYKTERTSGNS